uniref:Matrix-remodelling associated 7 n=1 Tax=Nothobranchius kuhntae TaxID=321403 RepID=A0A1A8I5C7_NOTKU
MDLTFVLSAIIFTLLAVVVATSLLSGSSPAADFANARSYFEHRGLEKPEAKQNGHVAEEKKKKEAESWSEISGSSHDHWDVVKSVLSEQNYPHAPTEDVVEHSTSTSSLSVPSSGSRDISLETEGVAESPGNNAETVESDANNSLKYVPGKMRSHHLEMMMSKEELEEEQRVQHEQLAAIFQLLKDNKETFGDISEGDLEDQLRLYSI